MNLLEGTLDGTGSHFHCGQLQLDLSTMLGNPLARFAGRSLTIGMRAEDLQVVSPEQGWIRGEVDIMEDLGSDRYLHIQSSGIEVVARTGRETAPERGQLVGLNIEPRQMHFFHGGSRIEP
jgi:ABC-type sugar transport system ATPase subunit